MNVSNMSKGVLNKRMRPDEVKRYPCPHCKIVFRRIEHVKAHILSNHITRTVNGGSNSRSPSTSSGVSSTSSNSGEGVSRVAGIKQESQSHGMMPGMSLHCKKCKLTFPERVSYQKHMYAHAKQQSQSQRPANMLQVSNSSGQKVNLRELVTQIQTSAKEQSPKAQTQQDVMQKLTGLGMEISLHPLRKSTSGNDLGLVISSVQSVSQSFFDDLEKQKQAVFRPRPSTGAMRVVKKENLSTRSVLRSNGVNGVPAKLPPRTESPTPDSTSSANAAGDRDPLELPSASHVSHSDPSLDPPKLKKPKLEPKPNDDVILSSTRRTSRAVTYNEADQPKYISIVYKQKNGKTSKRRIFPCGQCTSKFENIETRKMHFMTVHGSSTKNRMEKKTVDPPPSQIIPQIIPAYEDHDDENVE